MSWEQRLLFNDTVIFTYNPVVRSNRTGFNDVPGIVKQLNKLLSYGVTSWIDTQLLVYCIVFKISIS